MAETLGSLCDKLSIVKLKEYHTKNEDKLILLIKQSKQLVQEIDEYVYNAFSNVINIEKLTFKSNKVHGLKNISFSKNDKSSLGQLIEKLSHANCLLQHEQEKIYDFENIPPPKKNDVIKKVALLNLERTSYIDEIDENFKNIILKKNEKNK